jgi:hypothetical protein
MHVPSAFLKKYRLNSVPLSQKRGVSSAKDQTHTTHDEGYSGIALDGEISVAPR